MNCSNCGHINPPNSRFCMKCGVNLPIATPEPPDLEASSTFSSIENPPPASSSKASDTIIFVGILIWVGIAIIEFILQTVVDEWFRPPVQYIFIALNFITALVPLLVSFAIKNKTMKAIAIVAAVLFLLRAFYGNIKWAMDMF